MRVGDKREREKKEELSMVDVFYEIQGFEWEMGIGKREGEPTIFVGF